MNCLFDIIWMILRNRCVINAEFFTLFLTCFHDQVTAVHFIEPTLSVKDEFLGLNDEGECLLSLVWLFVN